MVRKAKQKQRQLENDNTWLTVNKTFEDKLKNIEVDYV